MLKKIDKIDLKLIILGSITTFLVIVLGIGYASTILKEETIDNHLMISKLNASYISSDINQNLENIEFLVKNLSSVINLSQDKSVIHTKLVQLIKKSPMIRSINILKNNKILYSSNSLNIGLLIDDHNFLPKPLFHNNSLRVSTPWIGRDFNSAEDTVSLNIKSTNNSAFIPILIHTFIDKKLVPVIVNLNNDYIRNIFDNVIMINGLDVELLRYDNILLVSTNLEEILGKTKKMSQLLSNMENTHQDSGIIEQDEAKFISSFAIVKDYPFVVGVHINYEKSLSGWNEKSYKFFLITIGIVVICIFTVLILILLYRKGKENEILIHKQQIEDQEKFKHLFDDSHFLTVVLDKNAKIIDINEIARSFLNKKKNQLIGCSLWELNTWEKKEKKLIQRIFEKNKDIDIRQEINTLDKYNQKAIFDISIFIINKESDEYKYIAIAQDITERKKREKILQQAYTVFNHTRDGIVITDDRSNIIDVNNAFENITGYSKNEILNKNIRILKSNIHKKDFYVNMRETLAREGFWEGEIINFRKNNDLFTEWLTINKVIDKDTKVINYIGIFSDITTEKNKEKLLKEKETVIYQQSKMASMGEMIENIAHQWRQPLSIISTAATGMIVQKEYDLLSVEDEIKNLNAINDSAQYLSSTIDDFRDFMRKDKVVAPFDLADTIASALKLISSKIKNRNIKIINRSQSLIINGLKNEFIQVLINLLNNARDALEESSVKKRYIFIDSYEDDNAVILTIKDNAGGIKSEIISRIFEPYYTTKHQSQGTGIGLYMSDQIITNHLHGSIEIENSEFTYENEKYIGACFTIKIPKR
ncbi:MAG: PAS domain-containing sensor histidine kinase [Arcobacteraceae bacterium]